MMQKRQDGIRQMFQHSLVVHEPSALKGTHLLDRQQLHWLELDLHEEETVSTAHLCQQ